MRSFHYFFLDLEKNRVLFIGSVTKSRRSAQGGPDSDSDVQLSQDRPGPIRENLWCFGWDYSNMVMGQNPVPLVNIKIAGEWMFIHPNMAL